MAFFCLSAKIGALVVALLNLTIGMSIVVEYLLGRLDYMNTLSETVAKYSGNSTDDPATTPVNPFITTTTTVAPDPGTEEECNWICSVMNLLEPISFYVGFVLMFCFLFSSVVACFVSMLQTKHRKTFAYLAFLLTGAFVGCTFINCLAMFVLGTHWLDLVSLFVWGCLVQIYFTLVLVEYHESAEFQPVPTSP
ncbi:uncharacterized protein LOC110852814 [Folsomia candida]|uniref:Transmembrane protein n=1 Tax=Folsomia candida TaxID=158441 RepID=A0A226E3E6_FOLCA|nr:uncharacterized protein LOC110852814 [Folsomia candida]OXA51800.1 hypothetical protein Fcan01_12939 [Folsomia candida]